jgi:DNA-binding NarL/FixJ family response regulator
MLLWLMPQSDGLEATRRIRQAAPGTKVVVLSALADEPHRQMAQDSGADVFINKRDTVTALLPTIKALSGSAADPA